MFGVGDWVISDTDCLGYITGIHNNDQVSVKLIQNKHGRSMKMTTFKHIGQLKPAPMCTPDEELHYLIDLALKMNDEAWFMELVDKLEVKRNG